MIIDFTVGYFFAWKGTDIIELILYVSGSDNFVACGALSAWILFS
jgi:hypothetical protein